MRVTLEVVGFSDALFEFGPSGLDHIILEVTPQVIYYCAHSKPGVAYFPLEPIQVVSFNGISGVHLGLLHLSGYLEPYLLELYLYLSDRKHKLVYSGEDVHEIVCQDEVDGPVHLQVQGEVAPMIPIVVDGLADHLPLLDLDVAVVVLDVGKETDVGSIHLQVEVAGHTNLV